MRRTVQRKLTELILGTSFCLLAITLLCLGAYEVHSYRETTARSLSTIAEIVAENSAAVLLFDDEKLAQQILHGLRVEPEVSMAALFDKDGKLYATYPREVPRSEFPSQPMTDGIHLGFRDLTVWKPVMQGKVHAGTIYFKGDLNGTYQRLGVFALVLVLIALVSGAIAAVLYRYLRGRISEPLELLASSARKITSEKDYTIRARKVGNDEFGDLTDALNAMLDQIQAANVSLREQEERFRTLADNMVQFAWMTDAKGEFKWYNKRWHDYTGLDFPATKLHGWETIHPEHRDRLRARLPEFFASGTEWNDTFPIRGADGQYRWFLTHGIPIRDANGTVLRWFGTNTDVTELRNVQQDLRKARDEALAASTAKDDFLARLSHELRTPLSPVLLLVSDAVENEHLPKDVRVDFETIKKNVELEARLIDDLLDLTAVVCGKLVLHRQMVVANDIVRDALAKVTGDAAQRAVNVVTHLDAGNATVYCDSVRVQQAVWNVLKNAVKFSPPGGTVLVTTELCGGETGVVITITDEGIGMTPQEIGKVFDAFAQGDHAGSGGSHRFGGLGLGLAIAQRVIQMHSGKLVAASPGPGRGSSFSIELPIANVETVAPTASESTPSSDSFAPFDRPVLSVLLVEDHAATRLSLERLLKRRRFNVTSGGSLGEARALFGRGNFDLLVSDIGLPDGTGYELMQELRRTTKITGIALTGYGMEADITKALEAGFCIHLTKPINVAALDRALDTAIRAGISAPPFVPS